MSPFELRKNIVRQILREHTGEEVDPVVLDNPDYLNTLVDKMTVDTYYTFPMSNFKAVMIQRNPETGSYRFVVTYRAMRNVNRDGKSEGPWRPMEAGARADLKRFFKRKNQIRQMKDRYNQGRNSNFY